MVVPAVEASDQTKDHSPIVVQTAERAVALDSILNPEQGTAVVEEEQ